jgi:hypothetical protein
MAANFAAHLPRMAAASRTQPDIQHLVPAVVSLVTSLSEQVSERYPRQDSNLRSRLRRAVLYPLSYGGVPTPKNSRCTPGASGDQAAGVP